MPAIAKVNKLLRLPSDLLEGLTQWADEEDRSVNNLIVRLLRQALREHLEQKRQAA